jgi:hypothetical protein
VRRPNGEFHELGELTATLCDGELTSQCAARLEELIGASDAARQYFHDYVLLHAELCWECALEKPAAGRKPGGTSLLPRRWFSLTRKTLVHSAVAAALVLAVGIGLWGLFRGKGDGPPASPVAVAPAPQPEVAGSLSPPAEVARLGGTVAARWAEGAGPAEAGGCWAGRALALREGLAEVLFHSGVRVLIKAPAVLETQSPTCIRLVQGSIHVRVPHTAAGFTVRTPLATVVDQGTEFSVAVEPGGASEVEVLAGSVAISIPAGADGKDLKQVTHAGEAVRVLPVDRNGSSRLEHIPAGTRHYARSLAGCVAGLQSLVAADPHLIHYYPFEGSTAQEKRRDRRGRLPLLEVPMSDGNSGGAVDYSASGHDAGRLAIRPFRASRQGNSCGVGLQSEDVFQPPRAMTVELLLRCDCRERSENGMISAALATRQDHRNCSFLVASLDHGRLVQLLDGQAGWLESGFRFALGHWYYLASSFDAQQQETVVNTYVSDITTPKIGIDWVVRNQSIPGTPAPGRLGVGKGFDGDLANAYPWLGALGEIAIYDTILSQVTVQAHLDALTRPAPAGDMQR